MSDRDLVHVVAAAKLIGEERRRHEGFMERALRQAHRNPDRPFGAVIVERATGRLLAEAVNAVHESPIHQRVKPARSAGDPVQAVGADEVHAVLARLEAQHDGLRLALAGAPARSSSRRRRREMAGTTPGPAVPARPAQTAGGALAAEMAVKLRRLTGTVVSRRGIYAKASPEAISEFLDTR